VVDIYRKNGRSFKYIINIGALSSNALFSYCYYVIMLPVHSGGAVTTAFGVRYMPDIPFENSTHKLDDKTH